MLALLVQKFRFVIFTADFLSFVKKKKKCVFLSEPIGISIFHVYFPRYILYDFILYGMLYAVGVENQKQHFSRI